MAGDEKKFRMGTKKTFGNVNEWGHKDLNKSKIYKVLRNFFARISMNNIFTEKQEEQKTNAISQRFACQGKFQVVKAEYGWRQKQEMRQSPPSRAVVKKGMFGCYTKCYFHTLHGPCNSQVKLRDFTKQKTRELLSPQSRGISKPWFVSDLQAIQLLLFLLHHT